MYNNDMLAYETGTKSVIMSDSGAGRMPAVTAEYGGLTDALERIAKLSEELETRLQPILRQAEIMATANGADKQPAAGCALAENIRSDAERLHRYAGQLQGILKRLEI